jgi:flagellar basal-body rod protein FlgF
MDNAIYASLTRQSGLMQELRVVANNIANANTAGFRREGVIFAEHLARLDQRGDTLSMAHARGRLIDLGPGAMAETGGDLDLAIEGEGFFLLETGAGLRLTRAGAFTSSAEGELMTAEGFRVLDEGQAPIILPPSGGEITIGRDGTMSLGGTAFARLGVFAPPPELDAAQLGGSSFAIDAPPEPVEAPQLRQGFLEQSNVDPVFELTRMIEVQRAYELGQSFLDREDQRIKAAINVMSR